MSVTVTTYDRFADAAAALAADPSAWYLAGGTIVMRLVNDGQPPISTIVRTTDGALRQIRATGVQIEIGAGVTMSEVLAHRDLDFLYAPARAVGGPAIRNMATVGGNLFARAPFGDFATALLALDATVTAAGGREIPLQEFLANRDGGQNGLVSHVSVERPRGAENLRFLKVSRVRPKGAPVITIAACLPALGARVQGARVAYGGMAPTSIRVSAVEHALEGKNLDEQGISAALAAATEGCTPATDAIASDWYRREVAPVHLKRLLLGERG
jgi:CO/xanthine dehydrogenase FAD-binding subunit